MAEHSVSWKRTRNLDKPLAVCVEPCGMVIEVGPQSAVVYTAFSDRPGELTLEESEGEIIICPPDDFVRYQVEVDGKVEYSFP